MLLLSNDNIPTPGQQNLKTKLYASQAVQHSFFCLRVADPNCIISQRPLRSLQRKHKKLPPALVCSDVLLFSDSLQLTAIKVVLICVKRAIYREHFGIGKVQETGKKKVMNIKCKCHSKVIETYNNSKGNLTFWPETRS